MHQLAVAAAPGVAHRRWSRRRRLEVAGREHGHARDLEIGRQHASPRSAPARRRDAAPARAPARSAARPGRSRCRDAPRIRRWRRCRAAESRMRSSTMMPRSTCEAAARASAVLGRMPTAMTTSRRASARRPSARRASTRPPPGWRAVCASSTTRTPLPRRRSAAARAPLGVELALHQRGPSDARSVTGSPRLPARRPPRCRAARRRSRRPARPADALLHGLDIVRGRGT